MSHDPICIDTAIPALAPQVRDRDERGASLVEYALLVALIAVVCIGAVTFFGESTGESFSTSGSSLFATS